MNTPFPRSVASSLVDLDMWMIVHLQYTVFLNYLSPLGTDVLPASQLKIEGIHVLYITPDYLSLYFQVVNTLSLGMPVTLYLS